MQLWLKFYNRIMLFMKLAKSILCDDSNTSYNDQKFMSDNCQPFDVHNLEIH